MNKNALPSLLPLEGFDTIFASYFASKAITGPT